MLASLRPRGLYDLQKHSPSGKLGLSAQRKTARKRQPEHGQRIRTEAACAESRQFIVQKSVLSTALCHGCAQLCATALRTALVEEATWPQRSTQQPHTCAATGFVSTCFAACSVLADDD